ncbi:MAG: YbhB/YbcL family Raf kinase inhibitor-like protein [Acutalibacteraceae bacterium]
MNELYVSSPQFESEGWIPDCCSGYGDDKSPQLYIEGLPDETVSLAIVMDDLDHPIQPGFNHWVAWNIPPIKKIPGALPKGAVVDEPIHIEQGVAYGKHCYRGPKPPFNWNHRYRFAVYALNTILSLRSDAKKDDLLNAMKNHTLAEGMLFAKYQRKHK